MDKKTKQPGATGFLKIARNATTGLEEVDTHVDPFSDLIFQTIVDRWNYRNNGPISYPIFEFYWKSENKNGRVKHREIGKPNESMKMLHGLFQEFVESACVRSRKKILVSLPSCTAFKAGCSQFENAKKHLGGRYFYITDLSDAYGTVDTEILSLIITAILIAGEPTDSVNEEILDAVDGFFHAAQFGHGYRNKEILMRIEHHPIAKRVKKFISRFCRSSVGNGLVTGAPSSPYLFNLYCEILFDRSLRKFCKPSGERQITYSRYADDLVFSADRPILSKDRAAIRQKLAASDFRVNHRKSKVLFIEQGTVFITGVGLPRDGSKQLIYPQKIRYKLHALIKNWYERGDVEEDVVVGHIAQFKAYLKHILKPTKTDERTLALCTKFEKLRREFRRY